MLTQPALVALVLPADRGGEWLARFAIPGDDRRALGGQRDARDRLGAVLPDVVDYIAHALQEFAGILFDALWLAQQPDFAVGFMQALAPRIKNECTGSMGPLVDNEGTGGGAVLGVGIGRTDGHAPSRHLY